MGDVNDWELPEKPNAAIDCNFSDEEVFFLNLMVEVLVESIMQEPENENYYGNNE